MSSSFTENPATDWPHDPADAPTEPVSRLIYASLSQLQVPVLDEMRRIRDHAVVHNQIHGIRVALFHMFGRFVEWIEGPAHGIEALLKRVAQDTRHRDLYVIHRSEGKRRLFKPWIGSIAQSHEKPAEFDRRVASLRALHEQGARLEPASVWMALCSPLPVQAWPGAPDRSHPRVMMVSACHNCAFDLLHWLASHKRRDVVQRRFAGGAQDPIDVASDYLDLPAAGTRGLRLIANARKGLTMGVTHAFLPDYAAVVVVLDEEEPYNLRIIERVLQACRQVQHAPVIVGLGAHHTVTETLGQLVQAHGLLWRAARSPLARPEAADLWAALEPALALLD